MARVYPFDRARAAHRPHAATPPAGKADGKEGRHGGARAVFTPPTGQRRALSSAHPDAVAVGLVAVVAAVCAVAWFADQVTR